jgi:hypothetical protein
MGGACLRGHRHPRSARRARGASDSRQRQGGLHLGPDPARDAGAHPQLLRTGRDPHSQRLSLAQGDPDADPNPLSVRECLGYRDRRRLSHPLPLGSGDAHAVGLGNRQRESVELALA